MQEQLDDTSWAILQALQENARISYSELGKRVGLTAPAVTERVRKLEDAGIITGYHAAIDSSKLGLAVSVVVQLSSQHVRSKEIVRMAKESPEIMRCYNLTGKDCYMIEASVTSVEHLETLLEKLSAFGQTTTSIILSSPVKRRVVGRDALDYLDNTSVESGGK
jgi:Lrp/AsnC family transcriptional regulator, leucine-responsive regulatory protein